MAQNTEQTSVENAVAAWREATLSADKAGLENLLSKKLSYGHSSGKMDTKESFVEGIVSGKSKFLTMDLAEQKVIMHGKRLAIVRHNLVAKTFDNGVEGAAKLFVMQVWANEKGTWRMIARQAAKMPQ